MNTEKLSKLQASVRIGGKGTPRRKRQTVSKPSEDDRRAQEALMKNRSIRQLDGIEEVNMFCSDGSVIHLERPKVSAHVQANAFVVQGKDEQKSIAEMMPGILPQLGQDSLSMLKNLIRDYEKSGKGGTSTKFDENDDDDVPELVEDFEQVALNEEGLVD